MVLTKEHQILLCAFFWSLLLQPARGQQIQDLSQHFGDLGGDISPWTFVPQSNIDELSTTAHPGMVTLWDGGQHQNIKGILNQPIRIDDYALPWEFHLGFIQNNQAFKGISDNQVNYAYGLNIVVTYSDPSTWPADRSQLPPQSESYQILAIHLGNYGENYRVGLPQIRNSQLNYFDPAPEVYLVYARGELQSSQMGNWRVPYNWNGYFNPFTSWSKDGGPASYNIRFRANLVNSRRIDVGFGNGLHPGWRMDIISTSKDITGIWEIGPIIVLDSWMTDTLPGLLGVTGSPAVQAPDPLFEYFIDYAVFYGNGPGDFEQLSDEFNVPGYLGDQRWFQEGNAVAEIFSNPGYLTLTQLGQNGGCAMCPIFGPGFLDFSQFTPPFEIETRFIPPTNTQPWNLWWSMALFNQGGGAIGWTPGLQFVPGQGVFYINQNSTDPNVIAVNPNVNVLFSPPLTQELLTSRPLQMLVQFVDRSRLRVGFRNDEQTDWTFSLVHNTGSFGEINHISLPCPASFQGVLGDSGWGQGNSPEYQKILFDYVRFRYGLTGDIPVDATGPFVEDWNQCIINPEKWIVDQGNPPADAYQVVNVGNQDCALLISNANSDWAQHLYSIRQFKRGANLRCTFSLWGDPARQRPGGTFFPSSTGPNGPWHFGIRDNLEWSSQEACLSVWYPGLQWAQAGQWTGADNASTEFKNAYVQATTKTNAIKVRVWLGNDTGANFEYSADHGATWHTELDTRGIGLGMGAANRQPTLEGLRIGFVCINNYLFIDDIVVEDDDHPYSPPKSPSLWRLGWNNKR
jgi:hypothetical protein